MVIGSSGLTAADFAEIDAAARELAERLGEVRAPAIGRAIDEIHGPREARGAGVAGLLDPSTD